MWRRASQIGNKGFTVVVHGKRYHEETQATFSHARHGSGSSEAGSLKTPVIVVRDIEEAIFLADFIRGDRNRTELLEYFYW